MAITRTSLIAVAFALLSAPAMAVDYVACEAMQRANERLQLEQQKELTAAGQKVTRDFQAANCGQLEPLSAAWNKCLLDAGFPSQEDYTKVHAPIRAKYSARIEKVQADYVKAGCF